MQSLIDNICFPSVVHLSTHQNPNCGKTPSSPNLTCLLKAKIASWICWMLPTRPLDGHMCCYQKLSDWLAVTGRCLPGRLGGKWLLETCFMLLNMVPFLEIDQDIALTPSFQDDTFYIAMQYTFGILHCWYTNQPASLPQALGLPTRAELAEQKRQVVWWEWSYQGAVNDPTDAYPKIPKQIYRDQNADLIQNNGFLWLKISWTISKRPGQLRFGSYIHLPR